jgi:hypothetical protein
VKPPNDPAMPRDALALIAQLPEFLQLKRAQGWPEAEEDRHPFVTSFARLSKLLAVKRREVRRKVFHHRGTGYAALRRARAVGHTDRFLVESQPLPDPRRQALHDLHQPPRFRRSRRNGLGRSKRKEKLGRKHRSRRSSLAAHNTRAHGNSGLWPNSPEVPSNRLGGRHREVATPGPSAAPDSRAFRECRDFVRTSP